jgi:hypothetical protein
MALLRGVEIGTLYNLLGSMINDGFNTTIIHKNDIDKILIVM